IEPGDDPWVQGIVHELRNPDALQNDMELDTLTKYDAKCYIASLYLIDFKKEVLSKYPEYKTAQSTLLQELKAGSVQLAAMRIDSMLHRVLSEDIDRAVKKLQPTNIKIRPIDPKTHELVNFSLRLADPERSSINDAPLLRQLDCKWYFGDETRGAV